MLSKYNTGVISIMMFYKNKMNNIFYMLGSVVYCTSNNDICADYICLHQTNFLFQIEDLNTQHSMIFQELKFRNY